MGCMGSKHVGLYDDYDWRELPEDAKAAAEKLGYTKQIWDKDGKAPIEEKDWEELTDEEKAAAQVLGYDEKKWDKD